MSATAKRFILPIGLRKQLFCSVLVTDISNSNSGSDAKHLKKVLSNTTILKTELVVLALRGKRFNPHLFASKVKAVVIIGNEDGVTIHLFCPTEKQSEAQILETLKLNPDDDGLSLDEVKIKLASFKQCPHVLQGLPVNIGLRGTNPYMYNDKDKKILYDDRGFPLGSNGGISSALMKMYNFVPTFSLFQSQGMYNPKTGKWDGGAGDVISGKLQLAISDNTIRQPLFSDVDFSSFFSVSEVMFTVCHPKYKKGTFNILRPFGWEIWLACLLSVVAVGISLAVIYNIYRKIRHPAVIVTSSKNVPDFIQDSFAALVQFEPPPNFQHKKCHCSAACLTTTIWFWTGMLLVFAYNCNLRTNLVYKPTEAPIDTYQQFTELDLVVMMSSSSYVVVEFEVKHTVQFGESKNLHFTHKDLLKRDRDLLDKPAFNATRASETCEKNKGIYVWNNGVPTDLTKKVFDCKGALMNSRLLVRYAPREKDQFGRNIRIIVKEIKENLFVIFNGIMLPKYSSLTKVIDEGLALIKAAGLIYHYWNGPLYLEQTMPVDLFTFYDDSKDKLTMETYMLIFAIWGYGMVLALAVMVVENFMFYSKKRKQFERS